MIWDDEEMVMMMWGEEEEGDGGILGLPWVNGGVMGMIMKYGYGDDVIYGGEEGGV